MPLDPTPAAGRAERAAETEPLLIAAEPAIEPELLAPRTPLREPPADGVAPTPTPALALRPELPALLDGPIKRVEPMIVCSPAPGPPYPLSTGLTAIAPEGVTATANTPATADAIANLGIICLPGLPAFGPSDTEKASMPSASRTGNLDVLLESDASRLQAIFSAALSSSAVCKEIALLDSR